MSMEMYEVDELEEMVSYRRNVTGVAHTLFISPRGNARHAARIKIAINPPDSLDPRSEVAVMAIHDCTVVAGTVPPALRDQVARFVMLNRSVLLDYWNYKIDTDELRRRLQAI